MMRRRRRRRRKILLITALTAGAVLMLLLGVLVLKRTVVDSLLNRFSEPKIESIDLTGINSPYDMLISYKTGKVYASSLADEQVYPASITKVMTAIVAIEKIRNKDRTITMTDDIYDALYGRDASVAGFVSGEEVRVIDLLYGVMLPSGAECCLALAKDIAGSEEGFVELMNQKAKRLGMTNTHFCDTTGLHDPDHYSSARDLAVLMRYALRNETFRDIVSSSYHSTPGTNKHPDGITYYSTMFKNLGDTSVTGGQILGGKTGYTTQAGVCLASYAEIEGDWYILVTCGAAANGNPLHCYDARTIYSRLGEAIQAAE